MKTLLLWIAIFNVNAALALGPNWSKEQIDRVTYHNSGRFISGELEPQLLFDQLQDRFSGSPFDDILFLDHPAQGPRFTMNSLENILKNIREKKLAKVIDLDQPVFDKFARISNAGEIETMSFDQQARIEKEIDILAQSLNDKRYQRQNIDELQNQLRSLLADFNNRRQTQTLQDMVTTLFKIFISDDALAALRSSMSKPLFFSHATDRASGSRNEAIGTFARIAPACF
jgi:hypothetical protein